MLRFLKASAPLRIATTKYASIMSMSTKVKIIYTETDEAPALATYSLLPIVSNMTKKAGIAVEKVDISVGARILAQFPESLTADQRIPDNLAELGSLCKTPDANIIKLPNISASVPQLHGAIDELRAKGYNVPLYNADPTTEEEKIAKEKYGKVLGSAVNPVLREGNSDRRVAGPVKQYAAKNPHSMGSWSRACKSHVAHMSKGDFYASEKSVLMAKADVLRIEFVGKEDGAVQLMKGGIKVEENEIIDSSFMDVTELCAFFEKEISSCYKDQMLCSLHLKATMMKVSDPIMFGHFVNVFFKPVFEKHAELFKSINVNTRNGLNDVYEKLKLVPEVTKQEVLKDIDACYEKRPWLAMVNSAKGITNLHVPSDVIVDASMPVVVRDSGKMWNKDDELEDVKCIIPDRNYATAYQEIISFCKSNGQFDVSTMGNVANVGLMARKAEEYGSHDKTFEVSAAGTMRVCKEDGTVLMSQEVRQGDIFRACQTKDEPVRDWVRLAVSRARQTGSPAIFWLDQHRAHDAQLIQRVNMYMKEHDTSGLDISIMAPAHAMRLSCERCAAGQDTISVTGNVLRDYLTDLFPILELGTSAKMLSIVPLLAGGGLFETGAGGSAPKHVQQFVEEGHLRWDSLGEYLALAVSLEHLGVTSKNDRALKLGQALNNAISRLLDNRKTPGRKVNQLDNRASNFYISLYWAEFMAEVDPEYKPLAIKLKDNRTKIVEELKMSQGKPQDIGGYYKFDPVKASVCMRPSPTFNKIIDAEW